jgi:putative membrane protein
MTGILVRIVVNAIALYVTTLVLPEVTFGSGASIAEIVLVAIVFGLVNAFIKPIVKLLTLPLSAMTLGLFGLVVNGALLLVVAWLSSLLGATFSVGGYPPDFGVAAIGWAIVGAIVLGIVSAVLNLLPLPGDPR